MDHSIVSSFRRLGAGHFATVFVNDVRGGVVVKQVAYPCTASILEKEHSDLQQLHRVCGDNCLFRLPRPFGYYSSYWSFAKEAEIPRTVDLGLPPYAMYVMQRVWPVPNNITEQIRETFFPDQFKNQPSAPFLARLYLGRPFSNPSPRIFCSENYPLDASRMDVLGLPSGKIAQGMGQMLARIHFKAGKDGRDIEFVLCGDPENPLSRIPGFFVIDFNQMRPHNNDSDALVQSITINDPYYPRPDSPHWYDFCTAYITEAATSPPPALTVAHCVIEKLLVLWGKQTTGCETVVEEVAGHHAECSEL